MDRDLMFVDANVFIYAVGRPHPLRAAANDFFAEAGINRTELFTSAEVLQELMHVYLSQRRPNALRLAMELVKQANIAVWSLEKEDVELALQLHEQYPILSARDLCHLASCIRRGVSEIKTFDQALHTIAGEELRRSR